MTKQLDISNDLTPAQREALKKRLEALMIRAERTIERTRGDHDGYWHGTADAYNTVMKLIDGTFDDYALFDQHEDLITPDIESKVDLTAD